MPHNYKKTGSHYQSMDGSDVNPGTDPNFPKKTPFDAAIGATTIISGDTTASYNFGQRASTIIPDGVTILRTTSDFLFGNPATGSGNKTFGQKFSESGYPIFVKLNGNTFRCQILGGVALMKGIIFEDGLTYENALGSQVTMEECIFKNTSIDIQGGSLSLDFCQIFNGGSIGNDILSLKNSYIDSATTINMAAWFATPSTQFINNNVQCIFNVGGVLYELKRDRAGNAIDPNPTVNDIIAIDANIYTRGNFSQAPLHNNLSKGGYWGVSPASPNLLSGENTKNIGGVIQGATIVSTSTEFTTEATIVDLVLSIGDYVVQAPAVNGYVESGDIQAFPIPQQLGILLYDGLLAFDITDLGGTGNNLNVPAVINYLAGTAGANPRRPTVEIQWGDEEGVYTNNDYIPQDTYAKMELFAVPEVDTLGKGSGEPDFNLLSAEPISGNHIKAKLTLRNDL